MLVVGFLWELAQLVELCTVNAMVVGSCPTLPAMTTKQLGNIGEAKALSKFVELQVPVYQAFGDNEKSDLIADFNGKLQRIQVKTSEKCEDGKITFSLVSSTMHRKNGVRHKYTKEEVDYFALYNLATNILLLIPIELVLGRITVSFRIDGSKTHNQYNNLNWRDFEFGSIISAGSH